MQSPTREEMMKLRMYNEVADAQNKNDARCGCTMKLQMHKRRMMQVLDV